MDIITNYTAGEEAVGAIFGVTKVTGSARTRNPRALTGAPRETIERRRRTSKANTRPRLTTLLL
jgi:hypothetical protein